MTEQNPSNMPSDLANAFEDRPRGPVNRSKVESKAPPKTFEQNLRAVQNAEGVLSSVYATSSLDATVPGSDDDFSLSNVVADPRVDVEEEVERKMQMQELGAAVSLLPIRSRKAVALHFLQGKTYEKIGEELGVSRGRIGQIMEKSLKLLKKYMNGEISADQLRSAAPSKTAVEIQKLREEEDRRFVPLIESVRPILGEIDPRDRQLIEDAYSGRNVSFKELAEKYGSSPSSISGEASRALHRAKYLLEQKQQDGDRKRQETRSQVKDDWNPSKYKNDPDIQPGPNGELSPLLQRLVDDMSRSLMRGRSEFKKDFPNAFFADETMTDPERQIFSGRRSLQNPDDFPKLCSMGGITEAEGEALYRAAEQKYYSYVLD